MIKRLLAGLFLSFDLAAGASEKPNILIFIVDDMGIMDTSVAFVPDAEGKPQRFALNDFYRTPSMKKLASNGVRFATFYANSVCSPSRISLLTGQYSARHKTTQFIAPEKRNSGPVGWKWEGMKPGEVSLQGVLRDTGYTTAHVGKAHLGPVGKIGSDPTKLGFDFNIAGCAYGRPGTYYGEEGYGKGGKRAVPGLEKYHGSETFLSEALTLEAKDLLTEIVKKEKPFFMQMSHYAVHSPFDSDPRFAKHYANSDKSAKAQAFATLIEGMDKSLGDLIAHLEKIGEAEKTLVIFLGDNGSDAPVGGTMAVASSDPYRGKKGTFLEGGMLAPLIISWAKVSPDHPLQKKFPVKQGLVSGDFVTVCDLMPTILKITETNAPAEHVMDGQEITSYMASHQGEHKQEFLMHFPHGHRSSNYTVFRKGDWKLIKRYGSPPAKEFELYNLSEDRAERNNLVEKEPDKLQKMHQKMKDELNRTGAQYFKKGGKKKDGG